jgi:hypothetical protein
VGRTRHGGLLFQCEDYGQVAAMRFSLWPTATVTGGVTASSIASRTSSFQLLCKLRLVGIGAEDR